MKQQIKKFFIQNLKWIVLFISILGFLILVKNIINGKIITIDTKGYQIISTYLISDVMTPIAKIITNLGGVYWLLGETILFLVIIKNKKLSLTILLNLCLITLMNYTLKQIFQRPRPIEYRIINESGYSLPSGHSMVSMAFYGYLIYLIYKNVKNEHLKRCLILFLSILIISIGISRVYLGVHYTSDVLAGFLAAISYLIIYIFFLKKLLNFDNL